MFLGVNAFSFRIPLLLARPLSVFAGLIWVNSTHTPQQILRIGFIHIRTFWSVFVLFSFIPWFRWLRHSISEIGVQVFLYHRNRLL